MRFTWQPWNTAHIARHGVTPAETEAVFTAPDFVATNVPGEVRHVGRGTVSGHTYRVVFIREANGDLYVITCNREHPDRRFP